MMTRWVLLGFLGVLRGCPRRLFPVLAKPLEVVLWLVAGKDRRRLAQNVEKVFGLPAGSHFERMFARQVFRHQVICAMEMIRGIQDPGAIEIEGFDEVEALVRRAEAFGKGHIIVTAHHGAWEFCALYPAKAASKPYQVLAKPSRSRALTEVLDGLRSRMGVKVLWTDRKSLLKDMLSALKRGESVGFVMDQKPEGRKGPKVRFFDQETEFVSGPAAMAIKTGCAVIAVFCCRVGPFQYRLMATEIAPALHGETDETEFTQRMASEIERVIRLYPEQWTWNYKRWRA